MRGLELKYFVLKPRAKFRIDHYAEASQEAMQGIRRGGCRPSMTSEIYYPEAKKHINEI